MKTISRAKLRANKENALKGGIKTIEGKNISRWNSKKHGILRQTLTAEEEKLFPEVYQQFRDEFQPFGIVEEILVERLSILYLKLKRVAVAESEYLESLLNPRVSKTKFINGFENLNIASSVEEVINDGFTPSLPEDTYDYLGRTYSRYEEAVERRFYKALRELQRLQAIRKGEIVPASFLLPN